MLALTAAPMPAGIPLTATAAGIVFAGVLLTAWALVASRRERNAGD